MVSISRRILLALGAGLIACAGAGACTSLVGDLPKGTLLDATSDAAMSDEAVAEDGSDGGTGGDSTTGGDAPADGSAESAVAQEAGNHDSGIVDARSDSTSDTGAPVDAQEEEASPPPSGPGGPCSTNAGCTSGNFCSPEGICCNSPCNGSCEVCNAAGTCSPVPANEQPRTGHPACTNGGTAPCGGYCDGIDVACFYPTTQCASASCGCIGITGNCTQASAVNCAAGSCPAPTLTSCNGFACNGTVCGDTCSSSSGCAGLNCCHAVFTGACFMSCNSTCPANVTCQ